MELNSHLLYTTLHKFYSSITTAWHGRCIAELINRSEILHYNSFSISLVLELSNYALTAAYKLFLVNSSYSSHYSTLNFSSLKRRETTKVDVSCTQVIIWKICISRVRLGTQRIRFLLFGSFNGWSGKHDLETKYSNSVVITGVYFTE